MLLIILQVSIMVLDGSFSETDYNLNPYNVSENINNTAPDVWDFTSDPTAWGDTEFLILWAGIITTAGLIGVGLFVITKSDMALLFGAFTFLLGFGSIPIILLYQIITREVALFGCTTMPCAPAIIIWTLTGGLLGLMYVFACVEWWTNRQTS